MNQIRARLFVALGLMVLLAALSAYAADSPASGDPSADQVEQQLVVPEPEELGGCITCEGSYTVAEDSGAGEDCDESFKVLENNLQQAASSFCFGIGKLGGCDLKVVITESCHYDNGEYVTEGYGHHGCLEGDYFCPKW